MKSLAHIHLRDPYILPVPSVKKYYLYGTEGATAWSGNPVGFDAYVSEDLIHWEGPHAVFRPAEGFWSDHHYWAPEVYAFGEKYVMFASFKADRICRGTQALVADHPLGPFCPLGERPLTPPDWECLDGTLYTDEDGNHWMIFCKEWLQVKDGEMYAIPLSHNLDMPAGEPVLLFRASQAPWSKPGGGGEHVTDGPFLHRMESGELIMLWSSGGTKGYTMGIARSLSGKVTGPWKQGTQPLFGEDGGHGMIFRDLDGRLRMTIHSPNAHPMERPVIFELIEQEDRLTLAPTND
ncbi:glycoside hydrolase family 43 protein [Gorillibacterium massiliense]|uniref:glycoside hydrolase family 43 protein n=1 Tax=Gorillibacterium massiliense TaxID=1280390 RepID=UPI0004ADCFF0|nr:glycoside hydrolase family 43 protein [Gorillibacterium massiliense]